MLGGTNQATLLLQLIIIYSLDQIDSGTLSRNKTITSSSTYENTWVPERAIDGNPSRDSVKCSCCAGTSYESDPWYELDLGRNYIVDRIHVEGGNSNSSLHFRGMRIYLESVGSVHANFTIGEETRITEAIQNVDFVLPVPKSTRYVSLVLYGVTNLFAICELTVYGECADGEFGDNCENTCYCEEDPCNKTTGVCPSGKCLPGYNGTNCDTVNGCNYASRHCILGNWECTDGFYGQGCSEACGNCHNGESCNAVTGHCEHSCAAGYQAFPTCKTECAPGTYGVGCAKGCGNCKDGSTVCAKTNGFCEAGCAAGYMGDTCITACTAGLYGENCNNECGHCANGEPCDPVTGVCGNGCTAGYLTSLCNTECTMGTYGEGCTMRCGVCADWTACNITNGACLACEPGFFGTECKSTERMEEFCIKECLPLIISGWIFGGMTLLAAVGIIICITIRSRRTKQNPPQNDTRLYNIPTNSHGDEEHQYEIPSGNA